MLPPAQSLSIALPRPRQGPMSGAGSSVLFSGQEPAVPYQLGLSDPRLQRVFGRQGLYTEELDPYTQILKVRRPDNRVEPIGNYCHLKFLFPNGVHQLKFEQGWIGNCYFLSALGAMSQHPEGMIALAKMVQVETQPLQENVHKVVRYRVTFPGYPNEVIEVLPQELEIKSFKSTRKGITKHTSQGSLGVQGDQGVKVIERAYAKLLKQHNPNSEQSDLNLMDQGGSGTDGLTPFRPPGWKILRQSTGGMEDNISKLKRENTTVVLAWLIKHLDKAVVIMDDGRHQSFLRGINPVRGSFIVVDPRKTAQEQEYSIAQLINEFTSLTLALPKEFEEELSNLRPHRGMC